MKYKGFILLEVLVALTIVGIASVIYWESTIRTQAFNKQISQKFVLERLVHDFKILQSENMTQNLDLEGYSQIEDIRKRNNIMIIKFQSGEVFEVRL